MTSLVAVIRLIGAASAGGVCPCPASTPRRAAGQPIVRINAPGCPACGQL